MESMRDFRPNILVVQGDIADFYGVSSFSKSPDRSHTFPEEVADVNDGLDELDSLGAEEKVFIEGNHEYRFMRWLQDKAPELFGLMDVPKLFSLKERGWNYVPYKQSIKIGKLWATHDVGSAGRYSVFRAADTFQHSVVVAHTHRLTYIVEGNATGEHFVAAQFGWMGDVKQIDYMHRVKAEREWTLGFGTGLMREDGVVYLTPHPIIRKGRKHSVVVEGKEYCA